MAELLDNPLLYLTLTIGAYAFFTILKEKTGKGWINPFLFTVTAIVSILILFGIPYSTYMKGGSVITMFLTPVTSLLALSIYRERKKIKDNIVPILAGTTVGSVVSIASVIALSSVFRVDETIKLSLVTKSVTTPISLALTNMLGGIEGIAAIGVMVAGLMGNILAPALSKFFGFKTEGEKGIAIGTSSHALGTARALRMGEDVGAISSIPLSFSGIITVIVIMLIY